jgi:hypothetical protein
MAAVFWMALKYKMQISISLKRKGPGFFAREQRLIKNCISQTWASVDVKMETGANTILNFLRLNKNLKEMRFKLCEAVAHLLTLQ